MIPNPTVSDLESLEAVSEVLAPAAAAAERLRLVRATAEAEEARAVVELRQALMRMGRIALDDGHRDALARVLYWRHTDLAVRDIAIALGFAHQRTLLAAVGPVATGVGCDHCGTPLLATSRSRLTELQKLAAGRSHRHRPRPVCDTCDDLRALVVDDVGDDEWSPDMHELDEELVVSEGGRHPSHTVLV